MSQSKPCRLFSLPAELRNHIYTLLLQSRQNIRISHEGITKPRPYKLTFPNEIPSIFFANIIAATSSQAHQEAVPILYGNNTFLFASTRALTVSLAHISRLARHVRHITLDPLDCERGILRFSANVLTQVSALSTFTITVSNYHTDEAEEIASNTYH